MSNNRRMIGCDEVLYSHLKCFQKIMKELGKGLQNNFKYTFKCKIFKMYIKM